MLNLEHDSGKRKEGEIMKVILSMLMFVAVLGNGVAQASESWVYDSKATGLLTKVFESCPIQFIQAMKGADRIGKASYMSDRPGEWITITTEKGNYTGGQSKEVATLKISRKRIDVDGLPEQFKVTCELTESEKQDQ
jgi:hypothetical protein